MAQNAASWTPVKIPSVNLPYHKEKYDNIIAILTEKIKQMSPDDPHYDDYYGQICIAEIVRRLHSEFDQKIQNIASSWTNRKLQKAPENASLYSGNFVHDGMSFMLSAYVFHFKDYIGNSTVKSEQMKLIAGKLSNLIALFNESYDIALAHDQVEKLVHSAGGGCFEGQIESIFDAAAKINQDMTRKADENIYPTKEEAYADIAKKVDAMLEKRGIDISTYPLYAEEYYFQFLKPMLDTVFLGTKEKKVRFFDAVTDAEILDEKIRHIFNSIPEKNEHDPSGEWLSKQSEVLHENKNIRNLRSLRVLDQSRYVGGKESCGYHSIKNAMCMLNALALDTNPAGNVFDQDEFLRVYQHFEKTFKQKKSGEHDLSIPEALQFIAELEKKSPHDQAFTAEATHYHDIKEKQAGIRPLSVLSVTSSASGDYTPVYHLLSADDIKNILEISENPHLPLNHTFLVADNTLNAGHWFTLSIIQDEKGQKQWICMDSENNRTVRAEAITKMMDTILSDPKKFLENVSHAQSTSSIDKRRKAPPIPPRDTHTPPIPLPRDVSPEEDAAMLQADAVRPPAHVKRSPALRSHSPLKPISGSTHEATQNYDRFKHALDNISLGNTGHMTKNALNSLQKCVQTSSERNKDPASALQDLQNAARRIHLANVKDASLKSLIQEIVAYSSLKASSPPRIKR